MLMMTTTTMLLRLMVPLLLLSPPPSSGSIPEDPPPTEASSDIQKCVSGFCLPRDYVKLEKPAMDHVNVVNVDTEIMDVLTVSKNVY